MSKFFGVHILGILLAAIALYLVGWVWYGMLFMEPWQKFTGVHGDGGMSPTIMGLGFLICLIPAFGLAAILNWAGASKLYTCVKIGIGMALLLAIPVMAAGTIYQGDQIGLLLIDGSHAVVGWGVMGAVLSYFRGKDA